MIEIENLFNLIMKFEFTLLQPNNTWGTKELLESICPPAKKKKKKKLEKHFNVTFKICISHFLKFIPRTKNQQEQNFIWNYDQLTIPFKVIALIFGNKECCFKSAKTVGHVFVCQIIRSYFGSRWNLRFNPPIFFCFLATFFGYVASEHVSRF